MWCACSNWRTVGTTRSPPRKLSTTSWSLATRASAASSSTTLSTSSCSAAYGAASGTFTGASGIERREIESRGVEFIPGNTLVRTADDNRALVEQGLGLAAAGRLQPVIGQMFPLSKAADAHAAMEARATIGKTILVPG